MGSMIFTQRAIAVTAVVLAVTSVHAGFTVQERAPVRGCLKFPAYVKGSSAPPDTLLACPAGVTPPHSRRLNRVVVPSGDTLTIFTIPKKRA